MKQSPCGFERFLGPITRYVKGENWEEFREQSSIVEFIAENDRLPNAEDM